MKGECDFCQYNTALRCYPERNGRKEVNLCSICEKLSSVSGVLDNRGTGSPFPRGVTNQELLQAIAVAGNQILSELRKTI